MKIHAHELIGLIDTWFKEKKWNGMKMGWRPVEIEPTNKNRFYSRVLLGGLNDGGSSAYACDFFGCWESVSFVVSSTLTTQTLSQLWSTK